MKKILVPVDFSKSSERALDLALAVAEKFGSTLDILHVWEPPRFSGGEASPQVNGRPMGDYAVEQAARDMDKLVSRIPADKRASVNVHVEVGRAWERIIDHAKGYDLIVMGTHGHTGRVLSMAGSVAEAIVRLSPTPVLTVREP
ncbi:MAG TPA: universal stress protein [Polyangiaceae bacterium]|nr:universal stress protein [Polyangiaceae bacterium]